MTLRDSNKKPLQFGMKAHDEKISDSNNPLFLGHRWKDKIQNVPRRLKDSNFSSGMDVGSGIFDKTLNVWLLVPMSTLEMLIS